MNMTYQPSTPARLPKVTVNRKVADLKGGDRLVDGTEVFDTYAHGYRSGTVVLRVVDKAGRVTSRYVPAGTLVACLWR